MSKKADTPQRKARRNYEVRNKDAREQATMQFNTRLPREECDEICAFLKKHGISKVVLIREGYRAMNSAERKDYGPCAPAFIENTMPNGIRKKAHREDEAIRSYAAALRLFRNVRRKNDKRGRTDAKRIKVYVGFVFDTQTL